MDRESFDKILIEEGILSKETRDETWKTRPKDDIEEEALRAAAREFKKAFPFRCKEKEIKGGRDGC